MNEAVVIGTLKSDGTLELDSKPSLSPGRVQVILHPLPTTEKDDSFSQRVQAIWDNQKARGHVPRSVEEVEAERREFRQEWEERMRRIEQLRAEAENIRRGRS